MHKMHAASQPCLMYEVVSVPLTDLILCAALCCVLTFRMIVQGFVSS